jgi:hypothetical protein
MPYGEKLPRQNHRGNTWGNNLHNSRFGFSLRFRRAAASFIDAQQDVAEQDTARATIAALRAAVLGKTGHIADTVRRRKFRAKYSRLTPIARRVPHPVRMSGERVLSFRPLARPLLEIERGGPCPRRPRSQALFVSARMYSEAKSAINKLYTVGNHVWRARPSDSRKAASRPRCRCKTGQGYCRGAHFLRLADRNGEGPHWGKAENICSV